MKGLINSKNNDNKCFLWCHIRHLNPLNKNPAFLDLFISSDASICSTTTFPPLGNSDHIVVSVSIDFPSNSQRDTPFHRIAYDYSRADWTDFVEEALSSVLLLLLVNFVSGFTFELMSISLITSIR